jgi:hypothetical protein
MHKRCDAVNLLTFRCIQNSGRYANRDEVQLDIRKKFYTGLLCNNPMFVRKPSCSMNMSAEAL